MKLLISFLFSIIIFSSNLYASDNSRDNFIKKSNENTQQITPKLSNEQLQELIKKLPNKDSLKKTYKKTSNDFTEILKTIRPFIIPAIIIIWLITSSSNKPEEKPKKNTGILQCSVLSMPLMQHQMRHNRRGQIQQFFSYCLKNVVF